MLLETNTDSLGSRTATTVVPFGDQALTVVGAANGSLAGTLSSSLWWIVAIAGGLLSLIAGGTAERLLRRRHAAEALAFDVQRLLDRQQTISSVLQRAMIPPAPTGPPYLEVASRYLPGGDELELGGDWFDVIELDADRAFLAIGDVSGRGLTAGTVMASLRSAIRAFVSEGHSPGSVLGRLGPLLINNGDRRFATVEFLVLDRRHCRVTAAAAGHLPPLVISGGAAEYLDVPVGPPIGAVRQPTTYQEKSFDLAEDATILMFTDGLVERRGESIDDGLTRLSETAARATGTVDEVLHQITGELIAASTDDDTAVLGVRLT
jgi:serine phosphatase RsbU (regulator of sigma subunit)